MALALGLTALAGLLRFSGLDRVPGYYWDETFYAADAAAYLGRVPPALRPGHPVPEVSENSWMQPPLGKWAIAAGEWIIGENEWGWRVPSAVAGTAAVPLTFLLALELTDSLALGALAGLLVALDGLEIVQSRIATLDVFCATFALAGTYALVQARGRPGPSLSGPKLGGPVRRRGAPAGLPRPGYPAPHRGPPAGFLVSGLLLGMAVACKWSGLPFLVLAAGLGWAWLPARRPDWSVRRRLGAVLACFGAVPAAVYLASYTSFFTENGLAVGGFLHLQWDMFQYGRHFDPGSVAASPAWAWPLLRGSIDYTQGVFFGGGIRIVAGNVVRLRTLAVGNPVLWWAFLAAAPAVLWPLGRALRRRRSRPVPRPALSSRPEWVALGGYLAGWLPWLVPGRTEFVYYLLPAVPFMAVTVALALRALGAVAAGQAGPVALATGGGLAAGAAAAAWAYYSLWVTLPIGYYTFAHLTHLPGVH